MKLKPIFCLVIFALTFCKKEKTEPKIIVKPIITIPVSAKIKEWGYFLPGSYWIVRDSVTSVTDSVYVTSITTDTFSPYNSDTTFIMDRITINFHTNGNSFYSAYNLVDKLITEPNEKHFTIFSLDSIRLTNVNGQGMMKNYTMSNINIGGNNYNNARYCYISYTYPQHSAPPGWYIQANYWKKNIGMLKLNWKIYNSNIYEVIRYNVIQ